MAYRRRLFGRIEKINVIGKFRTTSYGEFGIEHSTWYVIRKKNGKEIVIEDKYVLVSEEELESIPDFV